MRWAQVLLASPRGVSDKASEPMIIFQSWSPSGFR